MSMNDPDWGRNSSGNQNNDEQQKPQDQDNNRRPGGRQDGPPDLDELWRDFNSRLNRLFGKKGGGDGGGPRGPLGGSGGPSMENAGKGFTAVIVIAVLVWLASGFYIVQEGREGVILQFGKYHHTSMPGFQWRLPYPIQSHEVVNSSQVRIVEVGYRNDVKSKVLREALMLTEDENIIDIQFAVQYRLKDAGDYLFNMVDPDESVKMAAETAIREVVGRSKMDFVLYEGREQIALNTAEVMQEILDKYGAGVLVSSVTVQGVQPPEQVQAAFDDAVKAGQDRERLKNDGQAYANDVIPRARGNAARLIEEANGYRERVVAQSEGDASRFKAILTEYEKAPKVTKDRLYLDAMQEIYSNVSKVIVGTKNNSQLLYLPLDKLIEKSGPPSSQDTSSSGSSGGGASSPTSKSSETAPATPRAGNDGFDTSVRDAMRNRDRGAR
ncbi:MAG: FtsH protease activity modulator HflK [Gammaproteobacteria bacterium]|uniref:FtsH protease activity modulator HflK n=1 Tax=Limnobacter sp. TaxID=2003368 RepID=UPI001DEE9503|nr:FtsH protease activity modulator HflK [Limnobacter sp.]MBU0782653.1 FtsH protease activity modulator HflK [Gammaproteobacteria bacterium]MBU0850241.1 FtsH protease activity modulator HflK [Gammaproteobacteria bacterium]MBU1266263.1 FtsH protease activity modulator HflK [Gammaproteobacteria bacterium]MBU1528672.1 FtsH protease activity modulator HflK [Gammaproteobacteria bacterium]MBU1780788.1 FtsH protease activity modulator HflK [Gammaproteobacteria bacterium]